MMTLYQILKTLKGLFADAPLEAVLEALEHLKRIGRPPDIDNQEPLRHWLQRLLPILDVIAGITPSSFDDDAVVLLRTAIEDDESWQALHSLLTSFSDGKVNAESNTTVLCKNVGVDIVTIMTVVQFLIKIFNLIRDEEPA